MYAKLCNDVVLTIPQALRS